MSLRLWPFAAEKVTATFCRHGPSAGTDAKRWSSHKRWLSPFPRATLSSCEPTDRVTALALVEAERVGVAEPAGDQSVAAGHEPAEIPAPAGVTHGNARPDADHRLTARAEQLPPGAVVARAGLNEYRVVGCGVWRFG